jgi:hypothetical protein
MLNLMKATYEYTPFAVLDKDMRANIMGENGGRAQDLATRADDRRQLGDGLFHAQVHAGSVGTFVYYVAFAIEIKIFYGIIERGPMEIAFLERIARDSRRALQ